MTREAQIKQAAIERGCIEGTAEYYGFIQGARYADQNPTNPWVTDRDPEIKGSISDAVLLLIDGMFYKVSRLERRKDGTEFWWGVDVANGEEVNAWMPIPQEPNND